MNEQSSFDEFKFCKTKVGRERRVASLFAEYAETYVSLLYHWYVIGTVAYSACHRLFFTCFYHFYNLCKVFFGKLIFFWSNRCKKLVKLTSAFWEGDIRQQRTELHFIETSLNSLFRPASVRFPNVSPSIINANSNPLFLSNLKKIIYYDH